MKLPGARSSWRRTARLKGLRSIVVWRTTSRRWLWITRLWFMPLRESLDAFFTKATEDNTGEVTLRLYKGGFQPVSRTSPNSLYSLDIASFTMGAEYDQKDARGFINLIGLPMQVRASLKLSKKAKKK